MSDRKVYLIPSYLSDQNDSTFLPQQVLDTIRNTSFFLVENIRTARRFISSLKLGIDISSLRFEVVDKRTSYEKIFQLVNSQEGDIGVISEAGLPGLADPGQLVVAFAHDNGIEVVPLPGASSIQTAIIASGFSGQAFTFHGYLPISKAERIKKIKQIESEVIKSGYTQIFMETPFRNESLYRDLLSALNKNTYLHISRDLFGSSQMTKTQPVFRWQVEKVELRKIPTVFCIGQFS